MCLYIFHLQLVVSCCQVNLPQASAVNCMRLGFLYCIQ